MKVTIQDIARKAGVSKTLVSMYLNKYRPPEQFSAESRKKIDEAVRELDYRPSAVARGLRTGKSRLIGFMIGNIANNFSAFFAQTLLNEASLNGYHLLIAPTRFNREEETQYLRALQERQVDGIIYHLWIYPESIQQIQCPVLQTLSADEHFESFGFEVSTALTQAIQRVKSHGYSSVCLISNQVNPECRLIADWDAGCVKACQKWGLDLTHLKYTHGTGEKWLETLCRKRPEVILADSRLRVTDILNYIAEYNLDYQPQFIYSYSLPVDFIHNLKVIGVIRLPFQEWASKIIKRMIELIENPQSVKQHARIQADFLEPDELRAYYLEQKRNHFYRQ